MCFLKKILFLLPSLFIFNGGMQNGYSQDTLKVNINATTKVDVCASEKRILIEIQTNEIYAKDSLLGYDFIIEFDPDNVIIEQALTASTLTSQIVSGGGFTHFGLLESGVFRASAYLPDDAKFIKGNLPLVVLSGRYIGECEGVASIRITDFEPVFYSFGSKKVIDYDHENYIYGEVANFNDRILEVKFGESSIKLGKNDSLKEIPVNYLFKSDAKINSAKVEFSKDTTKRIEMLSIKAAQNGVTLDSVFNYEDKLKTTINFNKNYQTNLPAIILKIKSTVDDNFKTKIKAIITETNKCNCVKNWVGDEVEITNVKSDTVISVNESKITSKSEVVQLVENDDFLIIKSNDLIKKIRIFSYLGDELKWLNDELPAFKIKMPQFALKKGINFIEVTTTTENKKNYIKFIK